MEPKSSGELSADKELQTSYISSPESLKSFKNATQNDTHKFSMVGNLHQSEEKFPFRIHAHNRVHSYSASGNERDDDGDDLDSENESVQILALSKLAWVEIHSHVNGSPTEDGNSAARPRVVDRGTQYESDTVDGSVQVDLAREGYNVDETRSEDTLPSVPENKEGDEVTSKKTTKLVLRKKRKRRPANKREKCIIYVVPSDDMLNRYGRYGVHGDQGDACTNPCVADGLNFGDGEVDQEVDSPWAESADSRQHKTLLDYLFQCLFWLGLCPRTISRKSSFLRWIAFSILSSAAVVHGTLIAKEEYLWTDDVLVRCIGVTYYSFSLFLQVYFVYLIVLKFDDIKELVGLVSSIRQYFPKSKVLVYVGLPLQSSILLATLYSIALTIAFHKGRDYDMEDVLVWRAFQLSVNLRAWQRSSLESLTKQVAEEFSGNSTTGEKILMGITGFSMQITGFAYGFIIRDVGIVIAVSILSLTVMYVDLLKIDRTPTEEECRKIWKFYKILRAVSNQTEKTFGIFLQIFHVNNVFFCSYFVVDNVLNREEIYVSLLRGLMVLKVLYFYLTAAKASKVNSKFRDWIQRHFTAQNTLFVDNSKFVTTANALDQIKTHPIGVGSGLFYVNYSFIMKFSTYVSSNIFFFAQHETN